MGLYNLLIKSLHLGTLYNEVPEYNGGKLGDKQTNEPIVERNEVEWNDYPLGEMGE